jgi:hypothetical protein
VAKSSAPISFDRSSPNDRVANSAFAARGRALLGLTNPRVVDRTPRLIKRRLAERAPRHSFLPAQARAHSLARRSRRESRTTTAISGRKPRLYLVGPPRSPGRRENQARTGIFAFPWTDGARACLMVSRRIG